MRTTTVVVALVSVLTAGCGGSGGSASTPDAGRDVSPGPDGSAAVGTPVAGSPTVRVQVVRVDGAPPFYVEVGPVEPAASDHAAGEHELHVVSEWRSAIEVAADDITVDLSGGTSEEGRLFPETTAVLQPEERTTLTVTLLADEQAQPPGVYETEILLPFWREPGPDPSRRAVDEVARVRLRYEFVTPSQLDARTPFCDHAVPAIEDINEAWQQPGGDPIVPTDTALEIIAGAARRLEDPRGAHVVDAVASLHRDLAPWRDDAADNSSEDQAHDGSGFSTHDLVGLVNELCGTSLHATGVTG